MFSSFEKGDFVEERMEKRKEFLVCIDSDGCVMDTMDLKHDKCLAPCMLMVWELGEYKIELTARWREINLYSLDRGTNRFRGLAKMLKEVNENYKRIEGLAGYVHWVSTTEELSDESLKEAYEETGNECMRKALAWSELVNGSMNFMHEGEVLAFDGVKEVLKEIVKEADIAVVSAGGNAEVQRDWKQNGLESYVNEFFTQEGGEKEILVEKLLEFGYDKDHVLMIGDAPSDLEAAGKNGILFYPILVREEEESWRKFLQGAWERFIALNYRGDFQRRVNQEFLDNF